MIVMAAMFIREQPTFVDLFGDSQNNGNNLFSLLNTCRYVGSTFTKWFFVYLIPGKIGIWKERPNNKLNPHLRI